MGAAREHSPGIVRHRCAGNLFGQDVDIRKVRELVALKRFGWRFTLPILFPNVHWPQSEGYAILRLSPTMRGTAWCDRQIRNVRFPISANRIANC